LPTQTKLEFNSEGRLTTETERNGNSNTFTYNASKQLEKVTDGDSRALTFKYNGEGLVESVTDPMGHVVSYTYSEKQLASVTIEGKVRWKFEYESPHLLKKVTDGRGHATTIKYEATTHRVTEEEVGGHVRKWKYGTNETTLTEPNGSETVETFNGAGEPTKITRAKGKSEETTTEYEYSSATYYMIKMVNGDKHEWKYGYDTEGNRTSETDPNGDEWKWEYDKKHDVIKETTPDGETTMIKRNSNGDPEVIERPIGSETQKTEYKYDEKGDVTEVIEPLTNITKFTYDAAGDKELETRARGEEYKWKYNEDSQVTEETDARGRTTKIERNEQGFPIKVTDRRGNTTGIKYDGNYNVESITDPNKHTTRYTYNEENLPTKVEEPNGDTTETEYDSEGQMIGHKDGNGHKWEYKRNALEQITEEKNPLGKIWKRTYEKAGNLEKLEDPEKHATEYTYDESNRLKKVKYSSGKPSEVTYEYNKDGKVTKMTDETGTTESTYDKLDRLTEYKSGAGKTIKYEYDLANLPTKITYPNGEHITRAYRENYKLGTITDWDGNVTTFDYTKDGTLEQIHYPSGAEDCTVYSVNEDEELTGAEFRETKCAAVVAKVAYERGKDGEITKITTKGLPGPEVNEAVYDENDRLIEANKKTYEYDKANNPTDIEGTAGYAYNEADELEKGGGNTYTYNEDGQRTKTKPTTGPSTTYSYDQAGNLTAVERPKEGETSEIKDTYTYDGTNLRQTQTINGTRANLTWDTAEALPVILEDETNSYIYGPENLPIEQISKTGTILYLHPDPQGSTRFLTNTKGETEAAYTYTPYGKLEGSTGTANTPLRYDGQYTNSGTGLIYLRARAYDPQTAQFLSIDPALDITGEPYTYADDNPLNHSDPTGRYWLKVGLAVVGGTALVIGTVIVLGVTSPIWIGVGVFVAVAGGITVAAVCIYAAYESVFKPLPPPE
jgi:RHS repeat-associated protein